MSTDAGVLDIPCLGRFFRLGMLYDCRSDCLVPGVTLWDSSTLQQATEQSPQPTSAFELISEDSLTSKTSHLGMQTNLKLSFLTGLVNISRSAKYLEDHKSSNRLQARVTFKYSGTTRFEKLTIDKLGTVHHPTVRGNATHIVTGILYGAEAFFVFDQKVAPGENYQTVHENMIKGIKYLPGNVTAADMTKVQCTVYCDFQLPENPTSFQDTAKVLEKLPKLAENNSIVVPKRVTLYPLDKLDSSAGRLLRDISPALVTEVESFVEVFHKLQMQCNDLIKTEVSTNFPAIQKQLSYFQEMLIAYKSNIVKQLGVLLPQVRGGESQEADMTKILRANEVSPFGKQKMLSWLSKKEREVNVLSSYLKNMKEIPFVASPNELDAIVSNFQYDFVLCFSFLITGENDAYLQCLSECLQTPQLKQGSNDVLPKQWHEDRTVIQDMRSKARQFKDFVDANKMQQNTTFIVSTCVDFESSTNNVAAILLFKDGIPENFCPPSQPGKPTSTKVTNDSILLEWSTPKCGGESVLSYTISYCMDNDPTNQWKVKRTQDSRNTTMITQLTPKAKYRFKVKAQCEIGVSPESEISDPIETSPNYTANQVEDETPVSPKPIINYPPIPNPKIPTSCPGKPNASKVTSSTVHLNWHIPQFGIERVKFYSVLYKQMNNPSAEWQTTRTQGSQNEFTVSRLVAKSVYCFKVRAECEGGVSPDSEMSDPIATSPPLVPGRPGKPMASKTIHNSIHLNWPGPKSGIEGVTFYSVLYRRMDDPSAEWHTTQTQGTQKAITVSELVPKAVYCFKIRAESEAGVSPDSEMSEPVATSPPPVPERPGKPIASKMTHKSIHLTWPGPKSGIEGVTFYSVLYRRMDDPLAEWQTTRTQGSQKEFTVGELAAKAVYCFKIRAESEAGVSPDSEMSEPIATSPPPVPGRPGKPIVSKVTHDSIHLTWPGPKSGVEGVTFYSVLYRRMDDPLSTWQTEKTTAIQNQITISGLSAKAVYCIKVCAESESGVGPESEISEPTMTDSLPAPGRPGKPTASKVTHNSIHLHWPRPKSGTDCIECYTVFYRQVGNQSLQWQSEKTKDTQTEVIVSGLQPNAIYRFKVCAESKTGVSPESEVSDIETKPPCVPERPGKPIASKITHNSVHLNWSVHEAGKGSIKCFSVLYRRVDDLSAEWQTENTQSYQNEVTVSGLVAKAVYCFKIRAENEAGVSPDSEMSEPIATSPPPVPGRPGKPIASKVTHNTIHLTWPGPKSGIEGVTFYSVLYRRMDDTSAEWQTTKTQGSQKEVTVSRLVAKAVYCFKVHAEGKDGIGPDSEMSEPIATSPPPIPGRPGKPTASKTTHESIHLNWPGPNTAVESVAFYSVLYRRMDDALSVWQTTKTQGSQKEVSVSGLAAKAVYCFKICAHTEAGFSPDSEMSEPIATSPPPVPGRPGKPTPCKLTHNSIHLTWPGPKSGAESVTFYSVLYSRMDDPSGEWLTTRTQGSQKEVTVSGLVPKAVYSFKVCAECEAGHGPESEINQITTSPLPIPSRPGKPNASEVSHNTIKVNWSHPENGAENVKYYTLSYCQVSNSWETKQTVDTAVSLIVSNLAAKTNYLFKVRAESEAGASSWSEVSFPIQTHSLPPPSQPGKPQISSLTHDTVVLKWNKPSSGAQDIKYYTVLYYAVEDHDFPDKWKANKTAGCIESVKVTGLKPFSVYCFKVRAESDTGCSSYSESSDPIQLQPPPAPSPPGKPIASDNDIIHNSILLKWAKPRQGGDYVKRYCISYRRSRDPPDQWQTRLSDEARTALSVSGLDHKTEYCFKVHAVSDYGISNDSEISTFATKTKVRLAEKMMSSGSAKLIENGPPAIYKLKLKEVTVDESNQLKKCAIGKPDPAGAPEEKVIMVLGATGAGKTTLINGMTNYLLGIEWGDDFRFKLIVDEDNQTASDTAQAHSQTKWITAYTFHHQKGSPLPYTLTIIDTPGFGDTGGLERDHRITAQIKGLFSMPPPDGVDHLNAIGFVTQAALARLTPTQKYIFDSILAIFGKDIASNIFMMATFADGGVPQVLAAIKAANIPSCDLFKFNNSSLCAKQNDNFAKMFWKMGVKSFEDFFAHLKTVEARSLRLTKEVLNEREHLETVIQGLLPQIKTVMSTMDELQQEETVLERLQVEATDLENKEFKYTVTVVHQQKIKLDPGEYVTNCMKCNFTCHFPCALPNNDQKWGCAAMNWPEAGENSVCGVCPGKCGWMSHENTQYRIEAHEEEEERTLDDLLEKFETVKSDKNAVKVTVEKIRHKVQDLQAKVYEMICEAQQILARLDEIALKPNPLTELDYIDLLIESEKQQCKPGYMKRLEYLQEARKNAEVIHQLKEGEDSEAPQWLKDAAQRAKQNMKKHTRGFQNPQFTRVQPTPTQKPHTKSKSSKGSKWWPF